MPDPNETREADAVEPESIEPEAVEDEAAEPESSKPESTEPESTEDEAAELESMTAESADADGSESDAGDDEAPEAESAETGPEPADAEPADAEPDPASVADDEPAADDDTESTEHDEPETSESESESEPTDETEPAADDAEAEPEAAAATSDDAARPDARRKVLQVLTARPGRAQIPVAILLGVLAFGVVVQGRTVSDSGDFAGARRGDLIQLLDSLDAARDRAETQLQDLQSKKRELENSSTRTQVALQDARDEANTLAILSGTVGATGPGIEIRIDDPASQVGASTLLNVIEELRDAGAEAIEINDTARVVAQTYLADDPDGISVDGTVVKPPFNIDVIGHPHTLSEAVEFPGGVTEIVESLGGSVDVNERETVNVTSLAVRREPQYAQPAD
ncbi:MAG TPA: DUF881 domain-containing protein [Nocardioidaceae bacterium]|nr:DUF881 domain-containing protein [Nocardioidaceae bacterium]